MGRDGRKTEVVHLLAAFERFSFIHFRGVVGGIASAHWIEAVMAMADDRSLYNFYVISSRSFRLNGLVLFPLCCNSPISGNAES